MSELKDFRNYFVFDGVPSTDFGLFINGNKTFDAPAADIENVVVPGKSGDLLRFRNRYENVTVSYDSWIMDDMRTNLRDLRSFLLSKTTYCRLEDTYHPDEYRLACYSGGLSASVSHENTLGTFTLSFTCKPQRYLKRGDTATIYTGKSTRLDNPSYFPAKPLIKIFGNGTLTIGEFTITVTNNEDDYLFFDCELMDAYKDSVNRNADVVTNARGYITVPPGTTLVNRTDDITRFEITPRWYYL